MNSGVRHSSPWSPAGLSVAGLFLARLLLCVPPALAVTHDVSVNTFFFDPQDITIAAGDSVRWNWVFGTHTVTEGANCTVHNPLFNSPSDNQHPVFIFQFNTPGVYDYFCELHCVTQGMFGSVTVTGQTGSPPRRRCRRVPIRRRAARRGSSTPRGPRDTPGKTASRR